MSPIRPARPYSPLNDRRKEVRLLTLLKNDTLLSHATRLRCQLTTVSLLDSPRYDCLSYCWGDHAAMETIEVNGIAMDITLSLSGALRVFRDTATRTELEDFHLWADALCIDQVSHRSVQKVSSNPRGIVCHSISETMIRADREQENVDERNKQVSIMDQIYRQATQVRIWLGSSAKQDSQEALLRMKASVAAFSEAANHELGRAVVHAPGELIQRYDALDEIVRLPYWSRGWILQELALAKRLTLYYGPWQYTFDIIDALMRIFAFYESCVEVVYDVERMDHTHVMERVQIFQPVCWAKLPGFIKRVDVRSAWNLMGRACTMKHDQVYSLLALLPAGFNIMPAYDRPWEEVHADFSFKIMLAGKDLSMLMRAEPYRQSLPSWAVDWSEVHPELPGDPSLYTAAPGTTFSLVMERPGIIKIRGCLVDTIDILGDLEEITNRQADESVEQYSARISRKVQTWNRLYAYRHSGDLSGIDPAILRVLTWDRSWLPNKSTARMTSEAAEQGKAAIDSAWEIGKSFPAEHDRLHAVVDRQHFFITAAGRPGLCARRVQPSDHICLLSSCSIPFCARPEVKTDGSTVYKLIGPCYVDSIMDGQALAEMPERRSSSGKSYAADELFDDMLIV